MTQKNKARRFRGDLWFDQHVDQRTRRALEHKQSEFAQLHRDETDEQLLQHLRQAAQTIGYTPNPHEMIGGAYILSRFQTWEHAVSAAGLPKPGRLRPMRDRYIYKVEYKLQVTAFQEQRRAEKADRQQLAREKSKLAEEMRTQWEQEGRQWGQLHHNDSDEELLTYIRSCAEKLGHTPVKSEVEGSYYLCKRFISWPLALTAAQLPLPQGMKPPLQKDICEYRKQREARRKRTGGTNLDG